MKPNDVRWLSHFGVLKRIKQIYPALIEALDEISVESKDPLASNLVLIMSNFKFLSKVHIMCDILSIIISV